MCAKFQARNSLTLSSSATPERYIVLLIKAVCSFQTSQNTSTATSPSATNPVAQKKYPVPQLVGVDGLPLVPPQPGLLGHTFGSFPFQVSVTQS
ncbi:hypothetical protein E2C01_002599 [Portunus trituberculatus]|uniref:Uncharacterized protein n=1 Tax=Portunus trituberculatus TaxID=210409 RepID=A0A5B7CK67_PORTR|nr:hypothetical protein [Portunus trituberculatus]